jgi:hypothetical protein
MSWLNIFGKSCPHRSATVVFYSVGTHLRVRDAAAKLRRFSKIQHQIKNNFRKV